jgi:hypothetical protein
MDENTLQNLRARADAKLRYAAVHLDELKAIGRLGGGDFDRAHQESFLFHLLSAKDAFLIEFNAYYPSGLPDKNLTLGTLRKALMQKGVASKELAELYSLEQDETSWLSQAKAMRDQSTHVTGVIRAFHLGGPNDGQVWLKNAKTDQSIERHFVDMFSEWIVGMEKLLERLRTSAIETMRSGS